MNTKSETINFTAAGYRGLHPAAVLAAWLCLLIMLHFVDMHKLFILAGGAAAWASGVNAVRLLGLLRRSRWLMLAIALVYAYAGNGALLWPQFGSLSPYAEGLAAGVMQLLRLLIILSSLAILLERLKLTGIMLALDTLLRPLALLGVNAEQTLVRLALTLNYIEKAESTSGSGWRELVGGNLHSRSEPEMQIQISRLPLAYSDWVFMGGMMLLLSWVVW